MGLISATCRNKAFFLLIFIKNAYICHKLFINIPQFPRKTPLKILVYERKICFDDCIVFCTFNDRVNGLQG